MRYRKFKADYLFTGKNILSDNRVLVTGSKGKIINIVDESEAGARRCIALQKRQP